MMMSSSKCKKFGLGLFIIFVIMLVILTGYISYVIISSFYSDDAKVNEKTANYISFLFEHNDNHLIKIKKPKVVSDDVGKLLIGDDYYSLDINVDEEQTKDKEVEYLVVAEPVGKTIDENFIRFYITDSDILENTSKVIAFDDFEEEKDLSGKVIYRGKFNKGETKQTIDLRVWVSEKYSEDDIAGFSYQLNVVVKS